MSDNDLRVIDELEDLFDRERNAILKGELGKLKRLVIHKEKLMQRITAFSIMDQDVLFKLQNKARSNQQLLEASLRGVQMISDRIKAIKAGPLNLKTYNQAGQSHALGTKKSKLEHRF